MLDEKTRLTGCQLVRDQVYRTIQEVGIDVYKAFIREAIEEGRRTLIGRVKQLAFPGEYETPSFIDLPWANDETVHPLAKKDTMMHAPLRMKIGGEGHLSLSFDGANQVGLPFLQLCALADAGGDVGPAHPDLVEF